MIICSDDKINGISVSTESVGYPKENLLDLDVKNPWRATTNTATIEVDVDNGANVLGLFLIENATTADITFRNSTFDALKNFQQTISALNNRIVFLLDVPGIVRVDIVLSGTENIGASVLRAGDGLTVLNPEYGLSRTYEDYSIIHPYKTGGYYTRKRKRARKYSGSLFLTTSEEEELQSIFEEHGPSPMMICLNDKSLQSDSFFGSLLVSGNPSTSYDFVDYVKLGFTAMEFV